MTRTLLVVAGEPDNLVALQQILRDRYRLIFAPSGGRAIEAAGRHRPDLILLDVSLPDLDGYEVCERLKAARATSAIPVIFISGTGGIEDEVRGFDAGAVDYVQKPVSAATLLRRIGTHLSLVQAHELDDSHRQAVSMLGEAGHYNDADTGMHIWRMAAYAAALAAKAGWSDELVQRVALAAPMHDIGKIGTPDTLLQAARPLTADEWTIMKRHTEIGYSILNKSKCQVFVMAAQIARHHHEKCDGTGYPDGLAGEAIPEVARIVALADVFDALTTERPYKAAWSVPDSVAEIRRGAGSHFEPRLVDLFDATLPEFLRIKAEWALKQAHLRDVDRLGDLPPKWGRNAAPLRASVSVAAPI